MQLDGKVVVLTGAKRIGAEIAVAAATRGADVAILYRSSIAEARQVEDRVSAVGRRALLVQADVGSPDQTSRAMAAIEHEFGRLDVLVNMASLYRHVAFDKVDATEWR